MKIFKKFVYTALAVSALTTSCSKSFLDEDTRSFLAPDNSYTTTDGFKTGLNGLYAYARLEFQTWNHDVFSQGATPQEALQIGTDIVVNKTQGTDATLAPFENYTLHNASSYVRNYWKFSYGLIGNANIILSSLENNNITWEDPENDPKLVKATAYFFRAYAYRYLTSLYGDVPWVEEVSKEPRKDFTRTPKQEVLTKMIEDLTYAAENLPADPDGVLDGELTAWAAYHYLAEALIAAGRHDEAVVAAKKVIDSGKFQLMKDRFGRDKNHPGDFFHDLFIETNQNRKSGNQETIWAMQLEYNTQGGGDKYTDWSKRAWVPFYSNIGGFTLADSLGGRGIGHLRPLDWWLNSYEDGDIRNSEFNIKRNWYYNDPNHANYGQKVVITEEMRESGNLYPTTTKFFYGRTADDPAYEGNMKDRVKIRLADTYLVLAEAYLMSNTPNTIEAANAINAIRARAKATLVAPAEVTVDFLLDERARELIGEEMRRITLNRFGTNVFVSRVKMHNPKSKDIFQDYMTIWPIPQEVIDANTDAIFPQNTGWE